MEQHIGNVQTKVCVICNVSIERVKFSKRQWHATNNSRKCIECINAIEKTHDGPRKKQRTSNPNLSHIRRFKAERRERESERLETGKHALLETGVVLPKVIQNEIWSFLDPAPCCNVCGFRGGTYCLDCYYNSSHLVGDTDKNHPCYRSGPPQLIDKHLCYECQQSKVCGNCDVPFAKIPLADLIACARVDECGVFLHACPESHAKRSKSVTSGTELCDVCDENYRFCDFCLEWSSIDDGFFTCESCSDSFHSDCLREVMVCRDDSLQYYYNLRNLCEDCYRHQSPDCPVCLETAAHENGETDIFQCDLCKFYLHVRCSTKNDFKKMWTSPNYKLSSRTLYESGVACDACWRFREHQHISPKLIQLSLRERELKRVEQRDINKLNLSKKLKAKGLAWNSTWWKTSCDAYHEFGEEFKSLDELIQDLVIDKLIFEFCPWKRYLAKAKMEDSITLTAGYIPDTPTSAFAYELALEKLKRLNLLDSTPWQSGMSVTEWRQKYFLML